jgi:flagellar basal-body rod protein FlgB
MLDKMTNRSDFKARPWCCAPSASASLPATSPADTPGYVGHYEFSEALRAATGTEPKTSSNHRRHARRCRRAALCTSSTLPQPERQARLHANPAPPGPEHRGHRERANFVDNAVRYEATLRFINGQAKTMLSAITGQ